MPDSLRREIRDLRELYWSDRDPDGRAFAPLADALRRAGDLGPAMDLLAEGLDRLPDFVSGHVVAGWVHRARGGEEQAEMSFRQALLLDPDNVSALRGLGFILVERGHAEEAAELFRRLDEREPGDPDVQARLLEVGEDPSGVVPIELLAPDAELTIVPIESLAPDEEPVAIEVLAPDAEASVQESAALGLDPFGQPIVPIESLAPDILTAAAGVAGLQETPPAKPRFATASARMDEALEDVAEDGSDDDGRTRFPRTRTMADLYASQGLHHRALTILDELIESDPADASLREQREDIRRQVDHTGAEGGSGFPG